MGGKGLSGGSGWSTGDPMVPDLNLAPPAGILRVMIALLMTLTLSALPVAAGKVTDSVRFGPHPVGYRVVHARDLTRAPGPAVDFEGAPTGLTAGTPVQISIWYPARARDDGPSMRYGDYRDLAEHRVDLAPVRAGDRNASIQSVLNAARFGLGRAWSRVRAESLLAEPMRAVRDAAPAEGRYPVVLGGLGVPGSAALLGEYLASHGYIVVSAPSLPATAGLQVTNRPAALEIQTRNLEFLRGFVRELPFADGRRLHVIGVNFDGMAAVNYQLRNMDALTVVSLDGWESKTLGVGVLLASPWFDVRRLRVPYLAFTQADQGRENLRPAPTLLDTLRYAERALYQVEGLHHLHFVDDRVALALDRVAERGAHGDAFAVVRAWLDGDTEAAPAQRHLMVAERRRAAPAVPTAAEFEDLVMAGDPGRLRSMVERIWRGVPGAHLFSEREIRLYAFRFRQREAWEMVETLLTLGVRAYPAADGLREQLDEVRRRNR